MHIDNKTTRSVLCDKDASYEDCEMAILRQAVEDANEKYKITANMLDPTNKKMVQIIEEFISNKKVLCYGGTAINNILPKEDQFYDFTKELPDYDFYSCDALNDAKELANIYYNAGFSNVEAKSGIHHGTYKVFVNFIGIADITQLERPIYKILLKESIVFNHIHYCPPNFLRMSMYLEFSRPAGDVSRWLKIQERLKRLNKHYPIHANDCKEILSKRSNMKSAHVIKTSSHLLNKKYKTQNDLMYNTIRDSFANEGLVFLGGYANMLYSEHMPKYVACKSKKIPDFDVLSENPQKSSEILKERLHEAGFKNVTIKKRAGVGEIISLHYEVSVGKDSVAFIYEPLACHSYNTVKHNGKNVNIASIDTMLSFYLAFMYVNRYYYDKDRILCMAHYLYEVQQDNVLSQDGLLKRFSIQCYGKQPTLETMREEKLRKFRELKNKKNSHEYEKWFFKYNPEYEIGQRGQRPGQGQRMHHYKTVKKINNHSHGRDRPRTSKQKYSLKNLLNKIISY